MPTPTLPAGVLPASGPYLSEFLVESVKRRTRMPISQATLDVSDVLAIADEQISSYVAPLMISEAEDYLTATVDVPILPGVTSYRPPARAMRLREVQFVDEHGNLADPPRIAIENLPSAAWGFYLLGEAVKLVNGDQFEGLSIRFTYYLRPSRLVETSSVGVVSGFGPPGGVVLAEPNLADGAITVDLVRGVAPFEVLAMDVPATVAGANVTFGPLALPDGFGKGDFVCLPQQTPGVQVHPDLFALVAQATALAILDSNGEDAAYARAEKELAKLDKIARDLLASRVEGEPIPIGAGYSPIWDRRWN